MKKVSRLTDLELLVMKTLWDNERDMTIQEIAEKIEEKKLSLASIAQATKHLISKEAVVVCRYVPVANVYARTFSPCFGPDDYIVWELRRLQKFLLGSGGQHTLAVVKMMLENCDEYTPEELDELERVVKELREKIESREQQ